VELEERTNEELATTPEAVLPPGSSADDLALAEDAVLSRRGRRVLPQAYDFRRPVQLSKGLARSLSIAGESYAKLLAISLGNTLRLPVTVSAQPLRQQAFDEHVRGLANPTCLGIVELPPIKSPCLLDIDINLVFAMIEKLLGSAGTATDLKREFTAIESRIARKLLQRLLGDLREAMQRLLAVGPNLKAIEHNPEYTYILGAGEPCIVLPFAVELGDLSGQLSLCLSLTSLDAELNGDGAAPNRDARDADERREDSRRLALVLDSTRAEVVAELARLPLPMAQLRQLAEGSVISLRKQVDEPLKVTVGGSPLFLAKMGRSHSKSAIKITRVLRPRENPLGGALDGQHLPNEGKR